MHANDLKGTFLYRVTVHVKRWPDFSIELRADDEWKARTRVMLFYPYDLSGDDVTYTVEQRQ